MATRLFGNYWVDNGKVTMQEKASYGDVEETVIYDPLIHNDTVFSSFIDTVLEEGKKINAAAVRAILGIR